MCAKILDFHDRQWLISRRMRYVPDRAGPFSRLSPFGGRTNTRLPGLGFPHARWEDGVELARQYCRTYGDRDTSNVNRLGIQLRQVFQNFYARARETTGSRSSEG